MREHDHLVEPLFGAFQPTAEEREPLQAPAPRRSRGRIATGLLLGLGALLAGLAWVL